MATRSGLDQSFSVAIPVLVINSSGTVR